MVIFLSGANFTPQRGLKSKKFRPLFAIVFLKVWHLLTMFLVSFCSSPRLQKDELTRLWLRCDVHTLSSAKILFRTRANTLYKILQVLLTLY